MSIFSALGGIVQGIGSIFGGSQAASGAKKGAHISAKSQMKAARLNLKYQKQFAQKGIQWKVKDARKAGINPLAALGAQTMSFAPSFVGTGDGGHAAAGAALQEGYSGMGQGFGRAIEAYQDSNTRSENNMYLRQLQAKQIENMDLQNQALASQIQLMNQPGQSPAYNQNQKLIVPGQGSMANVIPRTTTIDEQRGIDAGQIPDTSRINSGNNTQVVVPSKDAKQLVEDAFIPETQMAIRHNMDLLQNPRAAWVGPIGKHEDVTYNPFTGRLTKSLKPEWERRTIDRFYKEISKDSRYKRPYGRGTATNSGFHGF